ncbi:MAG: efflux RND transporter periplasmic adaptor subunit [Alphaproteobacteria bacterium]|nr:efflux RND transporter periplasmic adaptor subunit [Alphaproteobacteria bacterium]
MRVGTQLATIALLLGVGGGWFAFGDRLGLPNPLQLAGLSKPQEGTDDRPRGGAGVVDVVVASVRRGTVVDRLEAIGTARSREAVTLTSRQSGIVSAIHFEEGQRVRAGQVLIELDQTERKAELDQVAANVDDARVRLQRSRQLRGSGSVTEARLDELDAALRQAEARLRQVQARLDELRIVAPFEGRVGLRSVSLGALIQPGQAVTTLDDTSRIRVDFSVPELFVQRLRQGIAVEASSAAFGNRRFVGVVAVVDTRVDQVTRSVRMLAEFDNPDDELRPGLFMTVEITLDERPNALLVMEDAIDPVGDRAFVYVVRDRRAMRQEVKLGTRIPGEVEVREGLREGDVVVVRGLQRLRNGAPVNVTETMRRAAS